jgi:hypothetical protein
VRICSPVITAAPVLATLAQVIADGKGDVAGCVDATQVEDVLGSGAREPVAWKLPCSTRIIAGPFTGKRSTPWAPGACTTSCTRRSSSPTTTIFTGLVQPLALGEKNAENVLEIATPARRQLSAYVDEVRARYRRWLLPLDRRRRLRRDVERDPVHAGTSLTIRLEIVSSRS